MSAGYRPVSAQKLLMMRHKARARPRPDSRPAASARGYDHRWHRLRDWYIGQHPLCARCGDAANEVDHIRPLSRGGDHALENLQSLCRGCHHAKTAADNRGRG